MRPIAVIIFTYLIVGCSIEKDEVSRVTSPDGSFDTVLTEFSGGATTSFFYDVFVVDSGAPLSRKAIKITRIDGARRNERAYGLNLKWSDPATLRIEYYSAINISRPPPSFIQFGNRKIKITMHSGIIDPTAPPGGMYLNRKLSEQSASQSTQ